VHIKILYLKCLQVEAADPQIGTEPYAVVIVREHSVDDLIGQSLVDPESPERPRGGIEHVEPAIGSDPESPLRILINGKYDIVGDGIRVFWIVIIADTGTILRIQHAEATPIRTHPEIIPLILENGGIDKIMGRSVLLLCIQHITLESHVLLL